MLIIPASARYQIVEINEILVPQKKCTFGHQKMPGHRTKEFPRTPSACTFIKLQFKNTNLIAFSGSKLCIGLNLKMRLTPCVVHDPPQSLHRCAPRTRRIAAQQSGDNAPVTNNLDSGSSQPAWAPLSTPTAPPPPRLVQTQRGVPNFSQPIPEDPCQECGGTGKALCGACR